MKDKEKQIEVLPNHQEISDLANLLYSKQDEFNLSNPYEVGYVIINILGYRKIDKDSVVLTKSELKQNKKQAVKEFYDKAKKKSYPFPCAIGVEYAVSIRQLDETLKEVIDKGINK